MGLVGSDRGRVLAGLDDASLVVGLALALEVAGRAAALAGHEVLLVAVRDVTPWVWAAAYVPIVLPALLWAPAPEATPPAEVEVPALRERYVVEPPGGES
jgi:hypothetical protein